MQVDDARSLRSRTGWLGVACVAIAVAWGGGGGTTRGQDAAKPEQW